MSRKRWLSIAAGNALLAACLSSQAVGAAPAAASTACPWVGSTAPVATRVSQLLGQMTQAQKLSMVAGVGGAYVGNVPAIPALCVPALNLEDGPAGVGDGMTQVTQLPAPIDAAATWDTSAQQQYGSVIGSEQAGKGANVDLGPTVNLVRDPRWGRAFESEGEDPYLSGTLGAAEIKGVQDQGVLAQVKHLAVYNQETNRNTPSDNAIVDTRAIQELYLPAFQTATQQGAASSVMCSYSTINGAPACQNPYLMTTALDGQFGFTGFVTSDWGATQSTVASANSGLDMEMPSANYFGAPLATALGNGQVTQATLNSMVGRILTEMFTFGLFDKPASGSTGANVSTSAHINTGTQIAEEGTVLLKNAGGVLPLSGASGSSIAVLGNWQNSGGGSAAVSASAAVVTPQQGITARAGSGVNVQYSQGATTGSTLADVPASALTPTSGGGSGLTGQYYNNMTLTGSPVYTANSSTLDFNWVGGSPGTGVNTTQWSAKWTGTLTAPATGVYTFATTSDDGSRLFVNGQELVNQWQDQASTTRSGSIALTAGQAVPIEVDYYQNGGLSSLDLGWTPANYSTSAITSAVALAKSSTVAVVFAEDSESEGSDLSDIELPGDQNQLIADVAAANPHTIVVLDSGSAVTMPWINTVAGVFESWYPGQTEGTAIAALLFGDVNPSGKLPVTFPKSLADVPASTAAQWPGVNGQVQYSEGVDVGYRWYQAKGVAPLFPFGYGLSYTTFGYSNLSISGPNAQGASTVTATVTNTGTKAGSDIAQLYVGDPSTSGEPPQQLKGFQRVTLQPGASTQVTFSVPLHALAYWNDSTSSWTVPTGAYGIYVGDTSGSPQLSGTLQVSSASTGNTVTVTDPAGMSSPAGTAASLSIAASDSASGQTLTYTASGLPAGLSINAATGTISGTATTTGTSTVTVTATDTTGASGSTTFVWTVTPAGGNPSTTGPIVGYEGLCVDDRAASTANFNPIQVYTCNGTNAQQWTVASGNTLQVLGKCMDINGGGTANGTTVDLYDCNGTGAQVWVPQSGGALLNPQSGKCLDDTGYGGSGTQLQIWACGGTSNQDWTLPNG